VIKYEKTAPASGKSMLNSASRMQNQHTGAGRTPAAALVVLVVPAVLAVLVLDYRFLLVVSEYQGYQDHSHCQ